MSISSAVGVLSTDCFGELLTRMTCPCGKNLVNLSIPRWCQCAHHVPTAEGSSQPRYVVASDSENKGRGFVSIGGWLGWHRLLPDCRSGIESYHNTDRKVCVCRAGSLEDFDRHHFRIGRNQRVEQVLLVSRGVVRIWVTADLKQSDTHFDQYVGKKA